MIIYDIFLQMKKRGSSYLVVAVGIIIVLGVIFTVSYKYNVIFACDLVEKHYEEFALHILNALYAVNRLDEGSFSMMIGDRFRYFLSKDEITIYYEGKCKAKKNHISLSHNLKNVKTSVYKGIDFCVKKEDGYIKLC